MFASAGLLEGLDEQQQQQQRRERGFDEDLQAKVFTDAHNTQRQGRKGLGKSSTLKIVGACLGGAERLCAGVGDDECGAWQCSAGRRERAGGEPAVATAANWSRVCGLVARAGSGWQGKKVTFDEDGAADPGEQQQQEDAAAPAAAGERKSSSRKTTPTKKVKWGALAVQQLQQARRGQRGLKWKKLWPLLAAAAAEQQQGAETDGSQDKAWKKLQACGQLQIDGTRVSLAAA
jgi:hypothetical protein